MLWACDIPDVHVSSGGQEDKPEVGAGVAWPGVGIRLKDISLALPRCHRYWNLLHDTVGAREAPDLS